MENVILPIAKAGEVLGISDLNKLHDAGKRYGALIVVAGALHYINVDVFNKGVQSEIETKSAQAANRSLKKGEVGRSIGLLRARISRGPQLIEKKSTAVEVAKKDLANAKTGYDRYTGKRKLAELETGLTRLKENLVRDQADLDAILAEEPVE